MGTAALTFQDLSTASPRPRPIHRLVHIPRERLPGKSTWVYMHLFWKGIQWHPKINETKKQTSQMKQLKQIKPFEQCEQCDQCNPSLHIFWTTFHGDGEDRARCCTVRNGDCPWHLGRWDAVRNLVSKFIKCQMKRSESLSVSFEVRVASYFMILHDVQCPKCLCPKVNSSELT